MSLLQLEKIFIKHLPSDSVNYCLECWQKNPFSFKLSRERLTKLGDFRGSLNSDSYSISVNHNLNPYSFLLTYLHEYAHLLTFKKFKNRVEPHGKEWKSEFKKLMYPMLDEAIFPRSLCEVLKVHMRNPTASSQSDPKLVSALSEYDEKKGDPSLLTIRDLESGSFFEYKSKVYVRNEKRRTRVMCKCINTGQILLFHLSVEVKHLEQNPKLEKAINRKFDLVKLHSLESGKSFKYLDVEFLKIKLRRTKVLCEGLKDKKQYLIHKDALVEVFKT